MPLGIGEQEQSMTVEAGKNKTRSPRWIRWGIRLALLGLLGYWFQTELARDAIKNLSQISLLGLMEMAILSLFLMVVSSFRWKQLIVAFGNPPQSVWLLLKLSLVGHFYNTFVPGAVGGDVLRAAVTSEFYAKKKTSYLVVFLERFLGLSCVCVLLGMGLFAQPNSNSTLVKILVALGLLSIVGIAILLFNWQRLLGFATPYLDAVTNRTRVLHALALSMLGQVMTLLLFALICQQFGISLPLADYCFIFPLGLLASVLPISILGAGARELALVSLLVSKGETSQVDAISVSTAYLGCLWFLGITGGMLHLISGGLKTATTDSDTIQSSESSLPQD